MSKSRFIRLFKTFGMAEISILLPLLASPLGVYGMFEMFSRIAA